MKEYIIATASTCDLTKEYLTAHEVPFVSYTYTIGSQLFEDDCDNAVRAKVYQGMRNGDKLKTSMINEFIYADFFKSLLDTGKDVLFLDMSTKMSVSYEKSLIARDMVKDEYPEQRLTIVDTRCISGGLGLLVKEAVARKEQGASFDEVAAWVEQNKLKIAHRFTVDDLNYLKEGGRVSNSAALVGSLLAIKPVLYVPDVGTLDVTKKARGRKAALAEILRGVKADLAEIDPTGLHIDICHADCLQDSEFVRDEILKAYPQVGEINISSLGVVIGAHTGPGLLAVFYVCAKRNP